MKVTSRLVVEYDELTEAQWQKLFSKLEWSDGEQIHQPWLSRKNHVEIPRGAWSFLPDSVRYVDRRSFPGLSELLFAGKLDAPGFSGQVDALKSMLEQEQGLIIAQPGFGKTEVALAFASVAETNTLVLVHTQDILEQWISRAKKLLPTAEIGIIRGQHETIGDVTISTVQTFRRRLREEPEKYRALWGAVILDEAHHVPADSFAEIMNQMYAKYRFGFTATESRADNKHPYMKLVFGPVIYRKKFESKVPVKVLAVKSHKFFYRWRGSWDWRGLVNALIHDQKRNNVIGGLAAYEIQSGHSCLILSREIAHLENIYEEIRLTFNFDEGWMQQVKFLIGGQMTKAERDEVLTDFRSGKVKCLLATQLADEALDVPRLSRVFLTYPGKHDGRIIQQVGRALREHPEKNEALIYDIVDDKVGVLRRQWMQRKQAYSKMKIPVRKTRRGL